MSDISNMSNFSTLLQQGNVWLFVPGAIALVAKLKPRT